MSANEAAASVGRIAEVVAAIIAHLPIYALARAQRVSKTWQYEIDRSQLCQLKFFTERVPATEFLVHRAQDPSLPPEEREYTPWLKSYPNSEARWRDETLEKISTGHIEHKRTVCGTNQMLGRFVDNTDESAGVNGEPENSMTLSMRIDAPEKLASLPSGPWEDMYIANPPALKADVTFFYTFNDGPFRSEHLDVPLSLSAVSFGNDGLRMRNLTRTLREGLRTDVPDFWTWLPGSYSLYHQCLQIIELDTYLESYGFPKFKMASVGIELAVHEYDALVKTARAQGAPTPWYASDPSRSRVDINEVAWAGDDIDRFNQVISTVPDD